MHVFRKELVNGRERACQVQGYRLRLSEDLAFGDRADHSKSFTETTISRAETPSSHRPESLCSYNMQTARKIRDEMLVERGSGAGAGGEKLPIKRYMD